MKLPDKAHEILQRLLIAFQQGTIPAALARTIIPSLDVPCSHWSLNNRILALLAGTADARGFRQWTQVGRYVRPGRKCFYILAPLLVARSKEDEEDSDRDVRLAGFRAVPVFRVEDTAGEPLNYPPLAPSQPPPLADVADAWGLTVSYTDFSGPTAPAYGSYSPSQKRIRLATHDEVTFFHELAHAAHERAKGQLRHGQDWSQEVVAALTAATLLHLYGCRPDDGGAYAYIAGYAKEASKDAYRACLSVISEVEQCLNQILATAHSLAPAA
ncbi:MAG: hypothetical protein V1724_05145 [Chloroflexota bacterium]